MKREREIQKRIAELEGLLTETREGFLTNGNPQMLMLCPLYQAELGALRWVLGSDGTVKGDEHGG